MPFQKQTSQSTVCTQCSPSVLLSSPEPPVAQDHLSDPSSPPHPLFHSPQGLLSLPSFLVAPQGLVDPQAQPCRSLPSHHCLPGCPGGLDQHTHKSICSCKYTDGLQAHIYCWSITNTYYSTAELRDDVNLDTVSGYPAETKNTYLAILSLLSVPSVRRGPLADPPHLPVLVVQSLLYSPSHLQQA